jgi:hypothetical protein
MREIPTLHITILKEIAKQPTKYVSEPFLKKAFAVGPRKQMAEQFDMAQVLIDYITDAGRFTDDVLPPSLFTAGRKALCLKNSKISGKYIKKIIDNVCSELLTLDVSGTFQVDDSTVQYILKSCKELKTLSIRNCRKITDKSLEFIVQLGNNLTSIDLGGCINMSYEGINKFVQHKKMTALLELNLSGLPIQSDTLSLISGCCVNLTSLGIGYADIGEMALRYDLNADILHSNEYDDKSSKNAVLFQITMNMCLTHLSIHYPGTSFRQEGTLLRNLAFTGSALQ